MYTKKCIKLFFILFGISIGLLKAQCPEGSSPGVNLVVNGDFSAGNTGFITDYTVCTTSNCLFPLADNGYAVGSDPTFFHTSFTGKDHTTGTGNFMIINGGRTAFRAWSQVVAVKPNTNYVLSTWICSMFPSNIAHLSFSIDDVSFGNMYAPNTTNKWVELTAFWNSGSKTSVTYTIIDLNNTSAGNDFGLDDISIRECICNPTTKNISFCQKESALLDGGAGNDSYLWNSGKTTPTITVNAAGTYWVHTIKGSCDKTDTFNLTMNPLPAVSLGNDTALCQGQSLNLNAGNPGKIFLWSDNSTHQTLSVNKTGTYWVEVTDTNGCKKRDSLQLTVFPVPVVNLGNDTCVENPITLDAGSGQNFIYHWSTGATTQKINAAESGLYYVNVQSGTGSPCKDNDTINLKVIPSPAPDLGSDTSICLKKSITLNASQPNESPQYTYLWVPGGITTATYLFTPETAGKQTIAVTKTGCKAVTKSIIITVNLCEITVPNIFTPNSDGENDVFFIKGLEFFPNTRLLVYNRWGKKVFENDNYQNNWDGADCSDGVYYYIITFAKDLEPMKGTVTILR